MMFVTLAHAKSHLNMDQDDDDALITGYIKAASSAVKNYLKTASVFEPLRDSNYDPVLDSNGDAVYATDSNGEKLVRDEVQSAVLILMAWMYSYREGETGVINPAFEPGYLPPPVTALLYPLRTPSLA